MIYVSVKITPNLHQLSVVGSLLCVLQFHSIQGWQFQVSFMLAFFLFGFCLGVIEIVFFCCFFRRVIADLMLLLSLWQDFNYIMMSKGKPLQTTLVNQVLSFKLTSLIRKNVLATLFRTKFMFRLCPVSIFFRYIWFSIISTSTLI